MAGCRWSSNSSRFRDGEREQGDGPLAILAKRVSRSQPVERGPLGFVSTTGHGNAERERVRAANPLEEVVQDYFPLISDGRTLRALCPFHSEKTPSFKVSPEQGFYHCFGCQERGDVFSFVQKMEGLEFVEALKFLAQRAGITLEFRGKSESHRGSGEGLERARGYEVLRCADLWFQRQLAGPAGAEAKRYLLGRGFREETLTQFGVGFAPPGWSGLLDHLKRERISETEAVEAGLARTRAQGGAYDLFRGRAMFSIRNLQGRVVGFGGRVFGGEDRTEEPKYLNSPDSAFFKKGQLLFGLFEGRDPIRRARSLLLMEGYTDVMMAHQAGFPLAVATLGTALAEPNVEQICRHADTVTLVFDGDGPGRTAARKAVWLLLPRALTVKVALIPGGKDPADLLRQPGGREEFEQVLAKGEDALGFVLSELVAEFGVSSGQERTRVAREFFPYLDRVESEFPRAEAVKWLAQRLSAQEQLVLKEYRRWQEGKGRGRERAGLQGVQRRGAARPTRIGGAAAGGGANAATQLPGYEDAVLLCALSQEERARMILTLVPANTFRDPTLRVVAEVLTRQTGVSSVDFESPAVKSRYLALRDRLEVEAYSEEHAARLLRDVLLNELDRRSKRLRSLLSSGPSQQAGAGERAETEEGERPVRDLSGIMAEWRGVRAEIDRVRSMALPSWDSLVRVVRGLGGEDRGLEPWPAEPE